MPGCAWVRLGGGIGFAQTHSYRGSPMSKKLLFTFALFIFSQHARANWPVDTLLIDKTTGYTCRVTHTRLGGLFSYEILDGNGHRIGTGEVLSPLAFNDFRVCSSAINSANQFARLVRNAGAEVKAPGADSAGLRDAPAQKDNASAR